MFEEEVVVNRKPKEKLKAKSRSKADAEVWVPEVAAMVVMRMVLKSMPLGRIVETRMIPMSMLPVQRMLSMMTIPGLKSMFLPKKMYGTGMLYGQNPPQPSLYRVQVCG